MTNYKCKVQLGDRVKHHITGFVGIAHCISFWLNGCARVTIQPEGLEKGKAKDTYTVDDIELVVVKKAAFKSADARDNGGPRPEPARRRDPVR